MDQAAFERDGALHAGRRLDDDALDTLKALADARIGSRPGARLAGEPALDRLLAVDGAVGAVAAALTSAAARPGRAVMFDKTAETNWSVAWHQDRTIPVRDRIKVDGFGPWSTKDGVVHVAPPFEILARMVTLRVHLDAVGADNAPLRVAVGSHAFGRVAAFQAEALAATVPLLVCHAEVGDVWAYRTPILHASERSSAPGRRRVLQVDYADFTLPGGLVWQGPNAT